MPRPLLTACLALPVTRSRLQTTWNTLSQPAVCCHKLTQCDLTANNNREATTLLNSADWLWRRRDVEWRRTGTDNTANWYIQVDWFNNCMCLSVEHFLFNLQKNLTLCTNAKRCNNHTKRERCKHLRWANWLICNNRLSRTEFKSARQLKRQFKQENSVLVILILDQGYGVRTWLVTTCRFCRNNPLNKHWLTVCPFKSKQQQQLYDKPYTGGRYVETLNENTA